MDNRGFDDRFPGHDADDAVLVTRGGTRTAPSQPAHEPAIVDPTDGGVGEHEQRMTSGTDERRMHVRAYNHWVSLLRDRPYPAIGDLDPASIVDFGPHSVLLDFSGGVDNPAIQYLGRALRDECGVDQTITRINQVPARSLLSRLTDHYLQIIANQAPIGFEAEFVGTRGQHTMYRGILMPFSSDSQTIDFIYGVINWKVVVAPGEQAQLDAELAAAVGTAAIAPDETVQAARSTLLSGWADGPGAGSSADEGSDATLLADSLAAARESAAAAVTATSRSHAALYRALGRAHDFALAAAGAPDDYAAILAAARIVPQARAPMTAVAKLVFGADYDKTRLTEIATVLAHGARTGVGPGALARVVETAPGGIKGIVAAERAARRASRPEQSMAPAIVDRASIGRLTIDTGLAPGAAVVLVGRVGGDGAIDVLGTIDDARFAATATRRLR